MPEPDGRGRAGARAHGARNRSRLARQLATTRGRLRFGLALVVLGSVVFGVVAERAATARRDAVREATLTERRLVEAVELSAHMSDAHAIAAFSFLAGGPESSRSRREYARELRAAAEATARLGGQVASASRGSAAVRRISAQLPVYAGLIDAARANYRQGFPVGGAYLRAASRTMRDAGGLLPSALALYEIEARNLTASYERGVAGWLMLAVVIAGGALLVVVVATQLHLARATRRIVNPGLALATVVLVGLVAWIAVAFSAQRAALADAQRLGSDPVELLTATRILASRAQADESITLAARGGGEGEPRLADVDRGFQAVVAPIGASRPGPARGSGGLLHETSVSVGGDQREIDGIYAAYRRYLVVHRRVAAAERRGDYSQAVRRAVGEQRAPASSSKAAADALNVALGDAVRHAQRRFEHHATRAEASLGGLVQAIPLLTALCALLAVYGIGLRLREYR